MDPKLSGAIEVLVEQLQQQVREIAETKKTINALRKRGGEEPMFLDVEVEKIQAGSIRSDQFYGKPLSTAIQEYLEQRKNSGQGAAPAEEILRALEQGGFDFRAVGWKDNDRLRSLAISLAKNTKTFHKLPNGTFGLFSWYDQAMLKRAEKSQAKSDEASADEVSA